MNTIYHILDIVLITFHSALIVFNLFGWICKRTRILNLITLLLTGASWLFLGLIYGTLGYCPLTDWHFAILEKLGETNLPNSYVKYIIERLSGIDLNPSLADNITLYAFLAALLISLFFNIKDFANRKKSHKYR